MVHCKRCITAKWPTRIRQQLVAVWMMKSLMSLNWAWMKHAHWSLKVPPTIHRPVAYWASCGSWTTAVATPNYKTLMITFTMWNAECKLPNMWFPCESVTFHKISIFSSIGQLAVDSRPRSGRPFRIKTLFQTVDTIYFFFLFSFPIHQSDSILLYSAIKLNIWIEFNLQNFCITTVGTVQSKYISILTYKHNERIEFFYNLQQQKIQEKEKREKPIFAVSAKIESAKWKCIGSENIEIEIKMHFRFGRSMVCLLKMANPSEIS